MESVDFCPRGHVAWKFTGKMLVLHVCCMCVACVLHVLHVACALHWQAHTNHTREVGK